MRTGGSIAVERIVGAQETLAGKEHGQTKRKTLDWTGTNTDANEQEAQAEIKQTDSKTEQETKAETCTFY